VKEKATYNIADTVAVTSVNFFNCQETINYSRHELPGLCLSDTTSEPCM